MPRRKSISNSKVEDFEPRKKNPLGLLDDANLDAHLKSIKIRDKLTPVKLSDNEVRFDADFSLNGKFKTHLLETDNQYMSVVVNGGGGSDVTYYEVNADYLVHKTKTGQYPRESYNVAGDMYQYTRGGSHQYVHLGNYNFNYWNYISGAIREFIKFDASQNAIKIMDDADSGDMLKLAVDTAGASTISTIDDDGTAGHLTLDADGNTIVSIFDGNESGGGFHVSLAGAANRAVSFSGEVDNNTTFRMYEMGGTSTSDFLDITTFEEGATTISTVDGNASAAHLLLDADGRIIIDSVNSAGAVTDGTLFRTSGTTFGSITTHHALSTFTLFEAAGSSTNDYFEIQVDAAGATKLNTVDAAGATAHLTLNPDGDVKFDSDGILIKDNGDVSTPASGYGALYVNSDVLYFKTDGGTATNLLAGGGGTAKETVWFYKNFYSMSSSTWRGGYPDNDTANATVWGLSTALSGSNYTDTALTAWSAQSYSSWCAPADCTVTSFTANAYQSTADTDVTVGLWKVTPSGTTNHSGNWTCDYVGGITFTANADTSTMHANQTTTSLESGADFSTGDLLLICATDAPSNTGTDRSFWKINGSVLFEYD